MRDTIDKANANANLTPRQLIDAENARWNQPGPAQTTIKESFTPAASPEMEAIDEVVNPRLTKAVKAAVAEITYISPRTFSAIGVWSCFTPTLIHQVPELRGQIAELQKRYDETMALALAHVPRAAADAYRAHLTECETKTIETGNADHCLGKTQEDYERAYRQKFDNYRKASQKFAPRARELVLPHIQKYAQMVRDFADECAQQERAQYDFLSLPWKVSPMVATLYRAAEMVLEQKGAGHDPKSVAHFFDFDYEPTERATFEKP